MGQEWKGKDQGLERMHRVDKDLDEFKVLLYGRVYSLGPAVFELLVCSGVCVWSGCSMMLSPIPSSSLCYIPLRWRRLRGIHSTLD